MLEDPVNGTVSTTETIEGTVAEYSCILGHVLSSDAPRVCERNANQLLGSWSNVEPTCDSKPPVIQIHYREWCLHIYTNFKAGLTIISFTNRKAT